MVDDDVLLIEVADRIGVITLNRPERRNALDGRLIGALDAAVKRLAADDDVKVVVLTGAAPDGGTGGYCSGGDTQRDRSDATGMALGVPPDALDGDLARHDQHSAMLLHLMPKPTIAMVGGPAVGAGCSLAAACDLRFASDDAVLMAGFTPNGRTFLWTRIAGTAVARRLYLLNEKLTAHQALALGMVHEVVPAAQLRVYTMEVAGRLARIPRELVALVKDNLNQAEDDADRRRFLFANEAANQIESGRLAAERLARRRAEA